jgi:molybdopterin biosynthesis enzyme
MPSGADAVVMVEETERAGDQVSVMTPVYPQQHVGRRAADIAIGQPVVKAGHVLNPSRIGAIAATGSLDINVYARPSVAILSTGTRSRSRASPSRPRRSTTSTASPSRRSSGATAAPASALPITADSVEELSAALDAALAHDIIVFSGGSSVGERDLILDVLHRRGTVHFHGIALKPASRRSSARSRASPSSECRAIRHPASRTPTCCSSRSSGRSRAFRPWRPLTVEAPLTRRVVSTTGRHQFYTVRLVDGNAEPAFKASGDITSMANADGYIEIPAQTDVVEAGTIVIVKLF